MSEILITSNDKLSAGGFILRESQGETPLLPERRELLITYEDQYELCEKLIELISQARNYIKLCSFVIQYQEVVEVLLRACTEQKVAVFILTAINEDNLDTRLVTEEERESKFQSTHFEMINALVKVGAHVKAAESNHAKFMLVDGTIGLLLSANLTEPSLRGNKKELPPNPESGFLISKLEDIKPLERLFDIIFRHGSPYSGFQKMGEQLQVVRKGYATLKSGMFSGTEDHAILWTYNKDTHIYRRILEMVGKAKRSIQLSTYSIVALNKLPDLVKAFEKAIERKVEIQVMCRAMSHRPDHLANCLKLSEMGIFIYGDLFNHSKGMVIDDNVEGMLFTANLDGNHGLTSGFEVGLSLSEGTLALSDLHAFLAWQIATAPFQFRVTPTRKVFYKAMKWSYAQKKTSPMAFSSELSAHVPTSMKSADEFIDAIKKYPLYFAKDKKSIRLGEKKWGVKTNTDKQFEVTQEIKKATTTEEYLWPYDRLTLKTIKQ